MFLTSFSHPGISVGCGLVVILLVVLFVYRMCSGGFSPSTLILGGSGGSKHHPTATWNDGTESGANDLVSSFSIMDIKWCENVCDLYLITATFFKFLKKDLYLLIMKDTSLSCICLYFYCE